MSSKELDPKSNEAPPQKVVAGPPASDTKLAEVRRLLKEQGCVADTECKEFATDACCRRYLRAHRGDAQRACAGIVDTVRFRKKIRPDRCVCALCIQDPHCHDMRVVGVDASGRGVIHMDYSQSSNRWDLDANTLHGERAIEEALLASESRLARCGPPAAPFAFSGSIETTTPSYEQLVVVVDFNGFVVRDTGPTSVRSILRAAKLLRHYPERLGLAVLVDAPTIFLPIWKAVRLILNEVTAAKVQFVRYNEKLRDTMAKPTSADKRNRGFGIGPEMADWLDTEMKNNRQAAKAKQIQCFWEWRDFTTGELLPHDGRGPVSWTSSPEFRLLLNPVHCRSLAMESRSEKRRLSQRIGWEF